MGRISVFQALRIKTEQRHQMSTFISQSSQRVYEAQIRRSLAEHGYQDRNVRLRDPRSIDSIDKHSTRVADSIYRTYNRMLRNKINAIPRSVNTDAAVKDTLDRTFLQPAIRYNSDVLNPWIQGRVRQMAQQDFVARNGITAQWRVVGPEPPLPDVCSIDLAKGLVDSLDDLEAEDGYPSHPNCQHHVEAVVQADTLPDGGSVWYGG